MQMQTTIRTIIQLRIFRMNSRIPVRSAPCTATNDDFKLCSMEFLRVAELDLQFLHDYEIVGSILF